MRLSVKKVDYITVKELLKDEKNLLVKDTNEFYALMMEDEIISVLSYYITKDKVKLQSFYTIPEYRGKRYFSTLLGYVLKELKNDKIKVVYVDALKQTRNILEHHNFEYIRKKQFKSFKIYYYRKEL